MDNEYTVREIKQYLAKVTEEEQNANSKLQELFNDGDIPEDVEFLCEKINGLLIKSIVIPAMPYHEVMNDVAESVTSTSVSKIMLLATGVEKELCIGDTPVSLLLRRRPSAIRKWLSQDHGCTYLFSEYESKLRGLLINVLGIRNIINAIDKFDSSVITAQDHGLVEKPGNILIIEEIIRINKRLRYGICINTSGSSTLGTFEGRLRAIKKKLKGQQA